MVNSALRYVSQGQNGGDVYIVGQSAKPVRVGDADLTVSMHHRCGGDLVLKGGRWCFGASGAVVIKVNGGSAHTVMYKS